MLMIKEYTSVNTIMETWQQDEKVFIRYFFFEKQPITNGSHEMYLFSVGYFKSICFFASSTSSERKRIT